MLLGLPGVVSVVVAHPLDVIVGLSLPGFFLEDVFDFVVALFLFFGRHVSKY